MKIDMTLFERHQICLIQSVPSPKAEPIKLWLAKVGYERMQEPSESLYSLDRARGLEKTWPQR